MGPASEAEPRSMTEASRYSAAVGITVLAILSQYFVPEAVPATRLVYYNLPGDLLIVYGIPVIAFLGLVGWGPLRNWRTNLRVAAWEGLGWYGVLSLTALLIVLSLAVVYLILDPSLLALLGRQNPALQEAAGRPWLFVGLSFAIGAIEETIFRGWIFGFWDRRGGSWIAAATGSSALFAGVHLYYGTTYGLASPLIFPTLFLTGFAFAAAYHYSGGNLIVVALLHGQMDAIAYLTLVSPAGVPSAIHYTIVFVGVIVAVVAFFWGGSTQRDRGPIGRILRYLGS